MSCKPIRNMDIMQSDTQLFKATLALACATCATFMWVYVKAGAIWWVARERRRVNADEETRVLGHVSAQSSSR